MLKTLLLFTLALTFNASYYVAIEDFYVDDAVPYLDDVEDECTIMINDAVDVLNDDADISGIFDVNTGYTPTTPSDFDKDSFKSFIEAVEEYIENVSLTMEGLPTDADLAT